MRRKTAKVISIALMLTMALALAPLDKAEAAWTESSSLEVKIPESMLAGNAALRTADIPVKLYKIADMDKNVQITAVDAYSTYRTEIEALSYASKADDVVKVIDDVSKLITADTAETYSFNRSSDGIAPGIYYGTTDTICEIYESSPFLVMIPYLDATVKGAPVWEENAELILKLEASVGHLRVVKNLDTWKEGTENAGFVFKVDVTYPKGREVHDSRSIAFSAPNSKGEKYIDFGPYPAGSRITITEIDTAGYNAVGNTVATIDSLQADVPSADGKSIEIPAANTVTFENEVTTDKLIQQHSIANIYTANKNADNTLAGFEAPAGGKVGGH